MTFCATSSAPSTLEIVSALRRQVPDFEGQGRWPSSVVFDAFADHVADRVSAGAANEELDAYFAFVEELAVSGDPGAENLVIVDFLEAAEWNADLLGPATKRLADDVSHSVAPRPDTTEAIEPATIHSQLIERFPALGELCFEILLTALAQTAWEAYVGDRPALARDAMGFAEWLIERGRADLAERSVSPLFDPSAAECAGAGPRVLAMLRQR